MQGGPRRKSSQFARSTSERLPVTPERPPVGPGPKKFAEPVSLSSTPPTDLPLPRRAPRWGFDLIALRARRSRHSRVRPGAMQGGPRKKSVAICEVVVGGPARILRVRRLVLLAGASSVLLAVCGGASSYHLAATRACLAKAKGVKLPRNQVTFARNQVTISFGRDSAEAAQLAKGYTRVHGKNIGIEDVLRPQHNAVMLWAAHPSDAELGTVTGCLK